MGAVVHCFILLWAFLDLFKLRNLAHVKPGIDESYLENSVWILAIRSP